MRTLGFDIERAPSCAESEGEVVIAMHVDGLRPILGTDVSRSGFCRDGFCCNQDCGGGNADDCQSCLGAETAGADGQCLPVASSMERVCRVGSGDSCDPDETCDGVLVDCPPDVLSPAETSCRPAISSCDVEEFCSGVTGDACPDNETLPNGTSCNDGIGSCLTGNCVDAMGSGGSDGGGGPGPEAGEEASGCSCSVVADRTTRLSPWAALVAAAIARRRRGTSRGRLNRST